MTITLVTAMNDPMVVLTVIGIVVDIAIGAIIAGLLCALLRRIRGARPLVPRLRRARRHHPPSRPPYRRPRLSRFQTGRP